MSESPFSPFRKRNPTYMMGMRASDLPQFLNGSKVRGCRSIIMPSSQTDEDSVSFEKPDEETKKQSESAILNRYEKEVAKTEQNALFFSRMMVLGVMFLALGALSGATFVITQNAQKREFETTVSFFSLYHSCGMLLSL